MMKIYLIIRFVLISSRYMNPRSKRVCAMNGCDANILFALKAIMKERPYTAITISSVLTIIIFGY